MTTRKKELIETYEDYINLLVEECCEMAHYAVGHGWESTRYEKGERLRKRIKKLKDLI